MIYWPRKTPGVNTDYSLNWGPTLARLNNPTITISTWSILRGDCTLGISSSDADGRGTQVRIGGGTEGSTCVIQNRITLSDGEILTGEALLEVKTV